MASQTEYAWAAGFFDGEGCVSLQTQGRRSRCSIIIVQKDIRPIERFRAIFEASDELGIVSRPNRKHFYYRLTLCAETAANALRMMLPYLVLKREVAEVAIDLQASINKFSVRARLAGLPDSEVEFRKALVAKAKWLNSGRWAAATTKPSGPETGCDSLNCTDGKGAEVAETTTRLQ